MKRMLLMFSILLMLSGASLTSAKTLPYRNLMEVANWSTVVRTAATPLSVNQLRYKNILDAAKWSRMINGRKLTVSLRKKAHASPVLEYGEDELFAVGARGSACNWICCMGNCLSDYPGGLCGTNCAACALTANPWGCAVCAGCSAVGLAAIELCSIHCCITAGGC